MKKFLSITSLVFLTFQFFGQSQNVSTIRTADVTFIKKLQPYSNVLDTIDSYFLSAKIDSIERVNKVYFLIGTAENSGNIMNVEGNVSSVSSQYVVSYNGQQYVFQNYTINIPIRLSKTQSETLRFVTFYVKDNKGLLTQKVYLKLK